MKLEDITVEVRDKNLVRVGQIVPRDLDLDVSMLFNAVGNWKVKLPSEHSMTPYLRTPGSGLVITYAGVELFSGPTVMSTFEAGKNDRIGSYVFEGVSDDVALDDRACYPDPTKADGGVTTVPRDSRTGNAEGVMHSYVNVNAGPGARSERKVYGLTLGTNLNRGPTITKTARFPKLITVLQEVADAYALGFRVVQRGTGLKFETFAINDRSMTVRLDIDNNTIAKQTTAIAAPTVTDVIVAGQGDLTQRDFVFATNTTAQAAAASWRRRIERFVDQRQTDDPNEYQQKADEVLADGGLTAIAVKAVPTDVTTMEYGKDWLLGDKVSVVTDIGEYASTVTAFILKADKDGFRTAAGLGDFEKFDASAAERRLMADLMRRIAQLEQNSTVNTHGGTAYTN